MWTWSEISGLAACDQGVPHADDRRWSTTGIEHGGREVAPSGHDQPVSQGAVMPHDRGSESRPGLIGRRLFMAQAAMSAVGSRRASAANNLPRTRVGPTDEFRLLRTLRLTNALIGLAWSPDNRTLATYEFASARITIWDASTGVALRRVTGTRAIRPPLAFNQPEGRLLLTEPPPAPEGPEQGVGALSAFDVQNGAWAWHVSGPSPSGITNRPLGIAIDQTGQYALTHVRSASPWPSGRDLLLFRFDLRGARFLESFTASDGVTSLAFGPEPGQFTFATYRGALDIRSFPTGALVRSFPVSGSSIRTFDISPDLRHFVTGQGIAPIRSNPSYPGQEFPTRDARPLQIWDAATGEALAGVDPPGAEVPYRSVRFHPAPKSATSRSIVSAASGDNMVRVHDADTLATRSVLHRFQDAAWTLEFSPDGGFLAVGGDDEVKIYVTN